MLSELYIQNFAIIDELRIRFDKGLNVLTGETGAGKSIILDAMALVLGERADTSMVRGGSDRAYVEATFILDPKVTSRINQLIEDEGLEGDSTELILLSRELRLSGRNICRVNGRSVNLVVQKEFGELLVDIHGQGEHLSLLRPRSHLPLLDAYADLDRERHEIGQLVKKLRNVQREMRNLLQDERSLAQRADLLRFQVNEINAANLHEGEDDELKDERHRLANVEKLMEQTNMALLALNGLDEEVPSMGDLLGKAEQAAEQVAGLDPAMEPFLERLQGVSYQLSDLTGELIDYQSRLEIDPARLSIVEERLELINRLKRKYGDDIKAVLSKRDSIERELTSIDQSEEQLAMLKDQEARLLARIGEQGKGLSSKRQTAATQLAAGVERELVDLQMEKAKFNVFLDWHESADGAPVGGKYISFDESGIDQIEFLVSTNPGEELKPLAKVASGGETSRLMLALKTALARVDATPTLIFDEIDQGIGGRVGDVVGRKLWGLTNPADHQVIVVTHLPQLAGYADGHYHVSKQPNDGRTTTRVLALDNPGRVKELAEMLGTDELHGIETAEAILNQANNTKKAKKKA